ncbi:putative aminotransferase/cysteine desulfurase [Rhodococcoides trifolii]|uniref:Aminotransferase/cysteine desulfurase n=1 Tax=Rhodococcoides trifolii TaxID=908250 RepID=A0A917G3U0_9NOCA|nr:aminotransferase class V-fold PLP-dependent enzyme [Rhodococcus trifolii]GGG20480.1 putative aminotransferase/cysteine desulfurase [Rhodococcus trifolii]
MTTVSFTACSTVSGADLDVPLVDGRSVRYANFDYAASAPALEAVTDAVRNLLPYYASVHRGAGYASRVSTQAYENARNAVGEFVNARDADVVVFTRNTTDSLNLLARCVPGDTVVLDIEHHATLLPWHGRRVVSAADTIDETCQRLVAELWSKPAALLAVTGASNVTGEVLPLARLARIAHECGARICVDAAQLAPHRSIDIADLGVDYVAFSGHKLYAPFGAGVLVGNRDWLDAADPYLAGGGAVSNVRVDETVWACAPARHEGGTPNVLGAVALAAACTALGTLDSSGHETALTELLKDGLAAVPGVSFLRIFDDVEDSVGIVSFTVDGYEPGHVAAYLSAEHGIGVRDGRFCAHPLLAKLGVPDGAVRASIGLGTSSEDVERLVGAVSALVGGVSTWNYARTDGYWNPVPDPRPLGTSVDGGALCIGVEPAERPGRVSEWSLRNDQKAL